MRFLLYGSSILSDRYPEECQKLLPHLFTLSAEHRREGKALQKALQVFEQALVESIDRVWQNVKPEKGGVESGQKRELQKPEVAKASWAIGLFDLEM